MLNMYITGLAPRICGQFVDDNQNEGSNTDAISATHSEMSSNPNVKSCPKYSPFDFTKPKLATRQSSRATLDTCCSTTIDDDDIFPDDEPSVGEVSVDDDVMDQDDSGIKDGSIVESSISDDCVEATLTTSGGVQVTVCSSLSSSIQMENGTFQHMSVTDLIHSGSQLAANGDYEASLRHYHLALKTLESDDEVGDSSPDNDDESDNDRFRANLCFTCGQLCRRMRDFVAAADFFEQELLYTSRYTSALEPTAANDLCLAKCYDGLASLYQYDMGDADSALEFYQQALLLEIEAMKKVLKIDCANCDDESIGGNSEISDNRKVSKPCVHLHLMAASIREQINKTKMNIGRIHFQNGNVGHALQMIRTSKHEKGVR